MANPSYKKPKKPKENTITMGQIRKKAKRDTGKSKCQRQHEQWRRKEFSHHGAKFSHCGDKFSHCVAKFSPSSFSASAPSFLLILICNVEFDSNSSCLNRFNKFGINSFQKLQN